MNEAQNRRALALAKERRAKIHGQPDAKSIEIIEAARAEILATDAAADETPLADETPSADETPLADETPEG